MAKADSDLSRRFPATGLPWVLAILGFVLYAFTLNHWIAAESLRTISRLQEITGQVEYTSPVFFVVTYPLRWLSAAHIPLAANGFTAVCAMLVLAQLGRCIALLAHDRTSMERQRNPHRHACSPCRWPGFRPWSPHWLSGCNLLFGSMPSLPPAKCSICCSLR